MPAISKVFECVSTATVAKSADEARELLFLRAEDRITMNRDRLLADAKLLALELVDGYQPPAPAEPLPQFAFSDGGEYLVQLAAFRTQDAAESAWSRVSKKSPALYSGAGKRIQRADLGAKGVFYRLRVGAFSNIATRTASSDAGER